MNIGQKIIVFLDKRARIFGAQYEAFGLFTALHFLFLYFSLGFLGEHSNEGVRARGLGILICVPLLLIRLWPEKIKKYRNLYWNLSLLYCLPTLGTYLLLKNHFSLVWIINGLLGVSLLLLLVDWKAFIAHLSLGMIFGYLWYVINMHDILPQQGGFNILGEFLGLYIYGYAILMAILFARNKEWLDHKRQLQALENLAGGIAHEIRTPLCGISATAFGLRKLLPALLQSYETPSQEKISNFSPFKKEDLDILKEVPELLEKTTGCIFTTIDILLMNLKEEPLDPTLGKCSIRKCINEAIHESYLDSPDLNLIAWRNKEDFEFYGNSLFVKHVFFNLLKNALYHVRAANKGGIFITLETGEKYNKIYFKDTGLGIPPAEFPYIFDRFYSTSHHGNGLGLAFCKIVMKSLGGKIKCISRAGEFTEFILYFPTVCPRSNSE